FEIEKRATHGLGFHASYTLSSVRSNVDSLANLADLPEGQSIESEMAPSRQDARHRFTATALSEVPARVGVLGGFKASALVSVESGRPFNIFVGRDANGDGNPNSDRPGLIGRNAYRGPAYASVDFRVGRDIPVSGPAKLELTLDVFNVLNRVNVKDINT